MAFAIFGVLFLCAVSAQVSTQNKILKKGQHYTIREVTGEPTPLIRRDMYKSIEIKPLNWTVPEDDEDNFGDMDYVVYDDGELVARDSILNDRYNVNVEIYYERKVKGYNATAIKILNFGRQRGWTFMGGFGPNGSWATQIWVEAGKEIRMFVELYGKPLKP